MATRSVMDTYNEASILLVAARALVEVMGASVHGPNEDPPLEDAAWGINFLIGKAEEAHKAIFEVALKGAKA